MLPDFLPAAETLAKGVKHIACYVADAISERRKAFDEDESGDYLACAGADALAESLGGMAKACGPYTVEEVFAERMKRWAAGPMSLLGYPTHCDQKCARYECVCPDSAVIPPTADDPAAEVSVCYFCDRPTERTVVCSADFDTEYVCEKCAHIAQSPAAHGVAADGPAEACDILQSPSAGHPTCKHCADPVELVIEAHPQYGRAGVWLHVGGDGLCRPTYASPK